MLGKMMETYVLTLNSNLSILATDCSVAYIISN